MSNQVNPICSTCDYFNQCNRTFTYQGNEYVAKEQTFLKMKCQNVVQDICRDCVLFQERRCASWRVVNGKVHNSSVLAQCPKKEPVEGK